MNATAPRIPSIIVLWDRFQLDQSATLVNLIHNLQRENLAFGGDVALRTAHPGGVSVELFVSREALTLEARSRIIMLASEVGAIAIDPGRMPTRDRFLFLGVYGRRHGRAVLVDRDPRVAVEQLFGMGTPQPVRGLSHRPRVLVADDSAFFRTTLCHAFLDLGCEVIVARDGAEAMEKVADEVLSLDLLVLDVTMPGMDGADVLDRIRRLGGERDLRIAVVTGSPQRRAELLHLGADEVLPKVGPMGPLAERLLAVAGPRPEQRLAG